MQQETANVVLPAEQELLRSHLEHRGREGVRMNVNFLGEALIGERQAERRLQSYLEALQRPEIEVISVKISTIFSQILPVARRRTVEILADRLELLFRGAAKNSFRRADGLEVSKFVYLDMEEYRDKEITTEAFVQALDRPGLEQVRSGIALQAYVPDSFQTQQRLTEWARLRAERGGAPITVRLVKGANMEMERVEASISGWPMPTYVDKIDTDANYLRMLRFGMQPENLSRGPGWASHRTICFRLPTGSSSHPTAMQSAKCSLRCSKEWRITSAARCLNYARTCCCTLRRAGKKTSSTQSAIWYAALMRTRGLKTFSAMPFFWKLAATYGKGWSRLLSTRTIGSTRLPRLRVVNKTGAAKSPMTMEPRRQTRALRKRPASAPLILAMNPTLTGR